MTWNVFREVLLNMSKKTQKTVQRTLFGGLVNEQTQQTYYNHPPRTLYERFVEAYYYFNKEDVGCKEGIIRNANGLWKENKGNKQYVNEYLQKQKEDKLKIRNSAHCALKSGFFKRCTSSSNELFKQTNKNHPLLNSALNHPPRLLVLLAAYYLSHLHQI